MKNHCSLFSISHSLSYLKRRFVPKHNSYIFRVQRVFWNLGNFEELSNEANEAWWMQSSVLWDPISQRKQRFGVISLEQKVWRAQVHQIDQAWRVFCCSCISTSFFSGLLTTWRATERFYAENFGFLFNNTSLCCLCICIFLPYSFTFHFTAMLL